MARIAASVPDVFLLTGRTRDEIAAKLEHAAREDLLDVIFALATYDRMLTARQIAEAEQIDRRAVLADMKAGRFVDPIYGAGFFVLASNSFRVTAAAANARRRRFFVRVRRRPEEKQQLQPDRDPLPAIKNNAGSLENGVSEKNGEQKAIADGPPGTGLLMPYQASRPAAGRAGDESGHDPGPDARASRESVARAPVTRVRTRRAQAGEGGVARRRPVAGRSIGQEPQKISTKGDP